MVADSVYMLDELGARYGGIAMRNANGSTFGSFRALLGLMLIHVDWIKLSRFKYIVSQNPSQFTATPSI